MKDLDIVHVISTGFYDGATEGFIIPAERSPLYFELIAWDSKQDYRLFAVESIEKSILDELITLLGPRPIEIHWIVNWRFNNEQSKERAEQLIETCKSELLKTTKLVFGTNITDALTSEVNLHETERQHLREVLQATEPEYLLAWKDTLESHGYTNYRN